MKLKDGSFLLALTWCIPGGVGDRMTWWYFYRSTLTSKCFEQMVPHGMVQLSIFIPPWSAYCYCNFIIAYSDGITNDWNVTVDPNDFQKNAFEWGLSMIPHSEDAIQVTQHIANFFVRWGFCCAEKLLAHAVNFFEMCWEGNSSVCILNWGCII